MWKLLNGTMGRCDVGTQSELLDFLLGGLIGAVRHAGAEAKSHNDG